MWPWPHLIMFAGMFIAHLWGMPAFMLDTLDDLRISKQQVYMATAMSLFMVFLEGFMHPMPSWAWFGCVVGVLWCYWAVRRQWFIGDKDYIADMIPHHSMAVLTSRKILDKTRAPHIKALASSILEQQITEIARMKNIQVVDGK